MSVPEPLPWLDYRLRGAAGPMRPGKHPDRQDGTGGAFRGVRPFWQLPDARRIDLRRSMMDPAGTLMVRQTEQATSLTLIVAVDLSTSMQPRADGAALSASVEIARAAARSAMRGGDAFGLLGFDRVVHPLLAPTRSRAGATAALDQLGTARCGVGSAAGLAELADHLPRRGCLVLLVSDFVLPLDHLETALGRLARHDVAPIRVRRDGAASLPGAGLIRLRDAENGSARLLALRPGLSRAWHKAEAARLAALDALFLRHGRAGFHCDGTPDFASLSQHLMTP